MNPRMRFLISNFAVTIAIFTAAGIANIWRNKVHIEWLQVPLQIEPTLTIGTSDKKRPWLINPLGGQGLNPTGEIRDLPGKAFGLALVFGIGMALLNYLDQNLTSKL